jgi:hypothetical protein
MKKNFKISCPGLKIIGTFFILLFAFSFSAKSQFLHSYGATIGVNRSSEFLESGDPDWDGLMKFRTGLNGSLFLEFFNHRVFTWVMEGQFSRMGSNYVNAAGEKYFKSRLDYLSFNNFLKARTEGIDNNLYVLAGPRVQYLAASNSNIYKNLAFAVSGGIGMDFNFFEPVILFSELQYIHGFLNNSGIGFPINNRGFELRFGIKKRIFKGSGYCPPVLL